MRKYFTAFFFCNRGCPKYEDILPKGMCHKYLKSNRIAQTAKIMERRNKDLFGFYNIGFKFIQLWFAGGTPKKSFIEQWLGEWFQNMFWMGSVSYVRPYHPIKPVWLKLLWQYLTGVYRRFLVHSYIHFQLLAFQLFLGNAPSHLFESVLNSSQNLRLLSIFLKRDLQMGQGIQEWTK